MRVMNTEWLLPTYKHVTFIAALTAVRTLQRQQHIPACPELFRFFAELFLSNLSLGVFRKVTNTVQYE